MKRTGRTPRADARWERLFLARELTPRAERLAAGRALRRQTGRGELAEWEPSDTRRSPLELLKASNAGRLADLIPERMRRMSASPLAFLRGSACVMAADLSSTPSSGIRVQACGDCHLENFGWFATPERQLAFDVVDFDETLPAAWEWDIKRLAASFAVAAREIRDGGRRAAREAVESCGRSYRERLREFARCATLETWYARLDAAALLAEAGGSAERRQIRAQLKEAQRKTVASMMPKLTELRRGRLRFRERPGLIFHPRGANANSAGVRRMLLSYRETLQEDRRELLGRFRVLDVVYKVVGVGSVGLRCGLALLVDDDQEPLILQVKEARPSVLEPYFGTGAIHHQGQRIVAGQRRMQSASDLFLGWCEDHKGRHYYVRQWRDMKHSLEVAQLTRNELADYARLCGWALARAHAKSGRAAEIAGYLGAGPRFEKALTRFAHAYADQTERDHDLLLRSQRSPNMRSAT